MWFELEAILALLIFMLTVVIIYETREYRKVTKLTSHLQTLVTTYTTAFEAVATAITALEENYKVVARENRHIDDKIIAIRTIAEIHNKALNLNPDLLLIGKDNSSEPYS